MRDEWLNVLVELTSKVKDQAEELSRSTRRIAKKMNDCRLGEYETPTLLKQKDTTGVLREPKARFTPGANGVVDIYRMPAYVDISSLYFVDGEWRLLCMFSDAPKDRDDRSARLSRAHFPKAHSAGFLTS